MILIDSPKLAIFKTWNQEGSQAYLNIGLWSDYYFYSKKRMAAFPDLFREEGEYD
jgi:hypothetical protein